MAEQDGKLETGAVAGGGNISSGLQERLHERERICAELTRLIGRDDPAAPEDFAALRQQYEQAPELPPEYAEILDKQFAEATAAFENWWRQAESRRARREEARAELEQLLGELSRLATADRMLPVRRQFERLESDWRKASADAGSDLEAQQAAFQELQSKVRAALEREEVAAKAAFEQLQQLSSELETLVAAPDCEGLKERKSALDAAHAALLGELNLEEKRVRELEAHFHELARKGSSRLAQHFQELDLARWESFTVKQDLLKELETLAAAEDRELPAVAKKFRLLREKWWKLGAVPREKQPEINPRFRELSEALKRRVDAYYEALHAEQRSAAAAKTALCEQAEALMSKTEWNATAEALKALQQEWKKLRHAGRELDDALYARFRAACNHFFEARNQYFERRNRECAAVAEVKAGLCAEAEALTPGPEAGRRARELRQRFQAAGSAGRQEPELYRRFNAALDQVFNARRNELSANAARFRELLAELKTLELSDPATAEKRARQLRRELGALNALPREQVAALEREEEQVWRDFEDRLAAARTSGARDRFARWRPLARELAAIWDLVREDRDEEAQARLAALNDEDYAPFPALMKFLQQLRAGDRTRLERSVNVAREEHERILRELEKATGHSAVNDLAAELTAAIAGNFGFSGNPVAPVVDKGRLLEEYLATGPLDAAGLEESCRRFEAAWSGE